MTKEEILEGNKLIAEFMGMVRHNHISYATWANSKGDHIFESVLQYHSSWDWLMPVVEKIESLKNSDDYEIDIFGNCCDIGGRFEAVGETKIAAVYIAVIEFIKWHKTQTK